MRVLLAAMLVMAATAQNSQWTPQFNFFKCYDADPTMRMPNTLDNLVALIEKYENASSFVTMDVMAEMIVGRYRQDGIVFRPNAARPWVVGDHDKESEKQALIEAITRPTQDFPMDSYEIREECGLHFLVSHSTDLYPFSGINEIWDGTIPYNGGGNTRSKRDVFSSSGSASSGSGFQSSNPFQSSNNYQASSNFQPSNSYLNSNPNSALAGPNAEPRKYSSQFEPAVHPVESGVMETAYGPVAAGTLLTGIMAMSDKTEYYLNSVVTDDTSYMPAEMSSVKLSPVHSASLAGDLAQMALFALTENQPPTNMGPTGRYHNCTTCAQRYSLYNNDYSLLSRAELNAGLDVMIINAAYTSGIGTSASSMSLSQLLRMYYSEHGLPGRPDYKACNRMQLYMNFDSTIKNKIAQQALYFMYAYVNDFDTLKSKVGINNDKFDEIDQHFQHFLSKSIDVMTSFISSYNYGDEGYARCAVSTSGQNWNTGSSTFPPSEGMADLIAVYNEDANPIKSSFNRQMIADIARRIGVYTKRSRLGVMRGSDGAWLVPYANFTNVGDWACNFTSDPYYGGSSGGGVSGGNNFDSVMAQLNIFYHQQYRAIMPKMETSSGNSLVVLWQVPDTLSGEVETNNKTIQDFHVRYPDVRILFLGTNKNQYQYLLVDDDDFITVADMNIDRAVEESVDMIHASPRFFMYPACNPDNSTEASNYIEDSHIYNGAVSPNFTTYIRIPAYTFHYSKKLELTVIGTNVRACFSRDNRYALENYSVKKTNKDFNIYTKQNVTCVGGPNDQEADTMKFEHLCDRDVTLCNPIFISVTGLGTGTAMSRCSSTAASNICEYPNQLTYKLSHKYMTCGAPTVAPALLLLLPLLIQYFLH